MIVEREIRLTARHAEDAKSVAYAMLDKLHPSLLYHCKPHTAGIVVPIARSLAQEEGFSLEDQVLETIGDSFHDTGFLRRYLHNETYGAKNAERYMRDSKLEYNRGHVIVVMDMIQDSDVRTEPRSKFGRVLRDADSAILGTTRYWEWNSKLREESLRYRQSELFVIARDDRLWAENELKYMRDTHRWFTETAKSWYEEQKQANIRELLSRNPQLVMK